MKIKNFIPFENLKEGLREVPMLTDETKKPYRDAVFQLLTVNPKDLNPSTLYYLKGNVEFQKELREKLLEQWHDTLKIGWLLTYEWDDGKEYSIMPPIVEIVEREISILPRPWEIDHSGKILKIKIPLLLDWFHRAFLAKKLWLDLQVIQVSNVDSSCPSYAHPNSWEDVIGYDKVPTDPELKKHYVLGDPKPLYKNFGKLVLSSLRK